MKKTFLLLAAIVVLAGCDQPVDGDDNGGVNKITFTIKNESSYDLSSVQWSNVSFASNNSSDILKATSSTKEVAENDTGYINFTRKDTGIELRTEATYSQSDSSATITDNTVVIEVGNDSNRGVLKEITFLPRLTVERNALQVAKNDAVTIGESTINTPAQQIPFTIKNTGKGTLTFTGNSPVQSSDPAFTVIQPSGSTVAANASLGFTLTFTPTEEKPYTTTVTIASNDKAGNFTFTVSGSGVASKPVLKIFQGETEISQSGTVNLGEVLVTQSITTEIIVRNTGDEVLTIDVANITLSGADAAAFTRLTAPGSDISPQGESRFTIQCTPSTQGENNAILTIPNNDNSRNPAVVYLKATGRLGSAVLELSQDATVIPDNGITPFDFGQVVVGSNKTLIFTIKNTGNIPLQLNGTPKVESSNAVFTISTQPAVNTLAPGESTPFIIRYTPTTETEDTSGITILNNSASLQFSFTVKGNGHILTPQITLKQGTTGLLYDGTYDFGVVPTDEPKTVVFSIGNTGDANLTFVTVDSKRINLNGNALGYFSVVSQPPASAAVAPDGTLDFSVRFSPATAGENFTATVVIKTNSRNNDEFIFTVKGTGYLKTPQITLKQGTTGLPYDGTYDFGVVPTDEPKTVVFSIGNTGDANLTFVTVESKRINLNDNALGYFSVVSQPPASAAVAPDGTLDFSVRFSPAAAGENFTATVVIKTNSRDNDEFIFTVKGTGYLKTPQITLKQGTTGLPYDGTYDFGVVPTDEPKTVVFSIGNTGDANLTFVTVDNKRINLNDNDSGYFSVVSQPSASAAVAPDGTLDFSVRFSPAAAGENFTATVVIKTNSRDNDEFIFTVKGGAYVKTPQITLSQDTAGIENHGTYDFGVVNTNETKPVVFTIGNSGEAPLTFVTVENNRVTLTDNVDGLFAVTQEPAASMQVAPGGTATFTILFSPVVEGHSSTVVTIKTNSKTDDEFTFTLTGSCVNKTYNVGDIGPAGGIVFYDKGTVSSGWRYLEAAPAETEFTAQWGGYPDITVTGTGTAIGGGIRNTELIVAALSLSTYSGTAARRCASLDFDGFNDWFLPSKDDLNLMYQNLKAKGLGGFSNVYYWSSSEYDYGHAWNQYFDGGSQGYTYLGSYVNKDRTYSVRAVRAF